MYRIKTEFNWSDTVDKTKSTIKLLNKQNVPQRVPIQHSDSIMVLLNQFYIRSNEEGIFGFGSAEVDIEFTFSTGSSTISVTLPRISGVQENQYLPFNDMVLLPRTKIEDFLSIRISAIETDKIEPAIEGANALLKFAETFHNPAITTHSQVIKNVTTVLSGIVTLASSLNPEDTILHKIVSTIVDEKRYPGFEADRYLYTGFLTIKEEGYADDEATRVILQVVKPVEQKTDGQTNDEKPISNA